MSSLNHRCLPLPRRRKRDEVGKCIGEISDLGEMDGMTYLASVNREASQLPNVFLANRDRDGAKMSISNDELCNEEHQSIEGSVAATNYLFSSRLEFELPPTSAHLPACVVNRVTTLEDWVNLTLSNFSSLRTYLSQCRATGLGSKGDKKRNHVPPSKDQPSWHVFCLGLDEASGNIGGYFQDDNNDIECFSHSTKGVDINSGKKDVDERRENQWDRKSVPPNGNSPTTSLLCQFDQIIVRRVLSHHLHYISSGWEMTVSRGRWIYALLARLEKPLHMDEASMLCSLLRELCRLRGKVKLSYDGNIRSPEILPILNILIVLTGKYFGQCSDIKTIMSVNH